MKPIHSLVFAVAIATWSSATWAGDFPTKNFAFDSNGYIDFMMPSGNVECIYTPAGGSNVSQTQDGNAELSCDRNEPSYLRVVLGVHGKAVIVRNVEDPSCCGGTNILDYGTSFRAGPFECDSMASGIRCENDNGHGFIVNKAHVEIH